MKATKGIYKLNGKVQHYAWGGVDYIPQLLGLKNEQQQPYAEYWMGAHPSAPSQVELGDATISLSQLISDQPDQYIGQKVNDRFKELPFLFKILDVKDMLSIQVHPTKAEAEKGFDREEADGIAINAPHRNYKDRNHKPEVMVALSDFWLLHGFKQEDDMTAVLMDVPEFNFLLPVFNNEGYYGLYKTVMELPQTSVDEILMPLVVRLQAAQKEYNRNEPAYWTTKLFNDNKPEKDLDRGIFSIYFFNIVEVKPGEAVFQGAGVPHAYLYGQNVELMANSDNVLRGGLTPKHIDVAELLKHTLFEGIKPEILTGTQSGQERVYPCPVEDFGLSNISLFKGSTFTGRTHSAEIFIVLEGDVTAGEGFSIRRGESFIVFAETDYSFTANSTALVFKAFVP